MTSIIHIYLRRIFARCQANKVRRPRSTPSRARGPGFLGVSECRAEFARREWVPVEGGGVARLSAGRKIGDYGRDVTILGWVEQ